MLHQPQVLVLDEPFNFLDPSSQSIIKHLLKAYNEETGASFFFELPLRQEPEEIICEPKAYLNELMMDDNSGQPSAKEVFDTTPYTILVVDDNPDMTDFLKRTFEGYFKRIIIAGDGVEALQLVRSHVPDIIVSDVMMPRMNGYKPVSYTHLTLPTNSRV